MRGYRTPKARVHERHPKAILNTTGHLGDGEEAWIYAAVTRDNRIKIGMTTDRHKRMIQLGTKLVYAIQVVKDAAKEIETHALRLLGHWKGDGEYVLRVEANRAADAIDEAFRVVGGYRHVDPSITEEEARLRRIGGGI